MRNVLSIFTLVIFSITPAHAFDWGDAVGAVVGAGIGIGIADAVDAEDAETVASGVVGAVIGYGVANAIEEGVGENDRSGRRSTPRGQQTVWGTARPGTRSVGHRPQQAVRQSGPASPWGTSRSAPAPSPCAPGTPPGYAELAGC